MKLRMKLPMKARVNGIGPRSELGSLLMSGAATRLLAAFGMIALLWLAVAWAMAPAA
jgi:hypothetical protein